MAILLCHRDPGLASLILGNKDEPEGKEWKGQILRSRGDSPLVIDSLCNEPGRQKVGFKGTSFEFAAQKEPWSTRMGKPTGETHPKSSSFGGRKSQQWE